MTYQANQSERLVNAYGNAERAHAAAVYTNAPADVIAARQALVFAAHAELVAALPPQAKAEPAGVSEWPKTDRVERTEDMSASGRLTVMLQRDGDVVVNVSKGETVQEWESATVEFCAGGGGGGRSMRTREALIALMVAMEADNAERPIADRAILSAAPSAGVREEAAGVERGPIPIEQLHAMRSEARASDECEREHWFILFARAIERAHGVALPLKEQQS